jgi:uncharacterized protein (DUF58 family)
MSTTTGQRGKLTDLLDGQFLARLDALDIHSRKMLAGRMQGERRSKRRGQGVEFSDHRPYVAGDDLRMVDWNIFGRLDQLFLKVFLEDQDLSVQVLLDTSESAGAGDPPKDRAMKRLAAALSYIALVNNNRVTISTFAGGLTGQLANLRGRNYVHRMADFLLSAEAGGASDFHAACKQLAAARIGAGVMIVISDFLFKDGFEAGLRQLVSPRYDLYAVHVLSPQEVEPKISGDLKLIDIEDGDEAEVTVSAAMMEHYRKTLAAYCREIETYCRRRGGTYVLTRSDQPVEPLVLNYLRRRGLVR